MSVPLTQALDSLEVLVTIPEKPKSHTDLLSERMSRYPSESKFQMFRNLSFGAAGSCLLMLSIIFPRGATELPLQISLYASAAGIPIWLTVGGLYESYIALGPKSYSHFRGTFAQPLFGLLYLLGGLALVSSLGGVLYFLSDTSAYILGGGIVFSILITVIFHVQLANWFYSSRSDAGDSTPPGV